MSSTVFSLTFLSGRNFKFRSPDFEVSELRYSIHHKVYFIIKSSAKMWQRNRLISAALCISGKTAGKGGRILQFLSALQLSANQGTQRHTRDSLRVREVFQVCILASLYSHIEAQARSYDYDSRRSKTKRSARSRRSRYCRTVVRESARVAFPRVTLRRLIKMVTISNIGHLFYLNVILIIPF